MAGTKLDIGGVMEGALKDKVNVLDPNALKEYAAKLKDVDPKVADAIKGLDGKSKDTIADLSKSLNTDVGAVALEKVRALPGDAQKVIQEQWAKLTQSPGNFFTGLWDGFKNLMKGDGPGAKLVQGLVVGSGIGSVVFGVMEVDKNVNGQNRGRTIPGKTKAQAQDAMVAGGQARTDDLNRATGAAGNDVSDRLNRYAEKVAAGAYLGEVEKQDPTNIPVETRDVRREQEFHRETRGRDGVVGNIGGGPGTPSAPAAPLAAASTAPVVSAASGHDVAFSHDQWASAAVHGTVAVATAQVTSATGSGSATKSMAGASEKPFKALTTRFNASVYGDVMKKMGLEGNKTLQEIKKGVETGNSVNALNFEP